MTSTAFRDRSLALSSNVYSQKELVTTTQKISGGTLCRHLSLRFIAVLNKFEEASTSLSHRYTLAERSRSPSFLI